MKKYSFIEEQATVLDKSTEFHVLSKNDFYDPLKMHLGPIVFMNKHVVEPGFKGNPVMEQKFEEIIFVERGTLSICDSRHLNCLHAGPSSLIYQSFEHVGIVNTYSNTSEDQLVYYTFKVAPDEINDVLNTRHSNLTEESKTNVWKTFLSTSVLNNIKQEMFLDFYNKLGDDTLELKPRDGFESIIIMPDGDITVTSFDTTVNLEKGELLHLEIPDTITFNKYEGRIIKIDFNPFSKQRRSDNGVIVYE